jgi:NADPH-dependent curcumin reductase CurA
MSGPIALSEVMRGGGIARVLESRSAMFQQGELVQARLGWQTHPTLPARYLQKVDETRGDALAWIGPLGLSAVTAYFCMRDIGAVKPGDRVLVSAAAAGGAVRLLRRSRKSRPVGLQVSPAGRRSAPGSPTNCGSTRSSTTRRRTT